MFAYCRNNPVCRIDISGREDLEIYLDDGSDGDVDCSPIDPDDVCKGGGGGTSTNGQSSGGSSGASGKISSNSVAMDTNDALDTAADFLGQGYSEAYPPGSGRFVSADGLRQVRIGYEDIIGAHAGAPHINLNYIGHKWSFHIYLM